MALKPGHTQTNVGAFPHDWEFVPLSHDIVALDAGVSVNSTDDEPHPGQPAILKTSAVEDGRFLPWECKAIVKQEWKRASLCVRGGTLLISRMNTIDLVGECGYVDRDHDQLFVPDRLWMTRIASRSQVDVRWLGYVLSSAPYRRALREIATGTSGSMKNIAKGALLSLRILRPPNAEQHTIARALSDVDGLIGALDRLIAKKRDLKQAAMQRLLTGRTRLPGFQGKWKFTRLGDHVSFLSHATHARAVLTTEGSVRYLHYGDVHAATSIWLDPRTTPMPFVPERLAGRFDRLQTGDLVFVDASEDLTGIGKSVELRDVEGMEIIAGLHTITARFDKSVLADGFKGYFQFMPPFKAQLQRLAAGTKVYASNKGHVSSVEIDLPEVDEQVAIAEVLNDMAAEIAALEARRDKTKLLKTGMMQELLTGRMRLVRAEAVPC